MKNNENNDHPDEKGMIPYQEVESRIITLRNVPVIADADVAALYGVETKRVNEAVRNNLGRFPEDYMFELTKSELYVLRSKISSTNVSVMNRNSGREDPVLGSGPNEHGRGKNRVPVLKNS